MKSIRFLIKWSVVCTLVFSFVACQSEDEPLPGIDMPMVITVPADNRETRVPGDPGTGLSYPLPNHARIYMVVNQTDGSRSVQASEETLRPDAWKLVAQDNYYRYDSSIRVQLPQNIASGRVFVVLSQERVIVKNDNPQTLQDVQNLQFDLGANANLNLKNLYANPVNDTDEKQNGTLQKDGKLLKTMVRCYHVAAKVDMMWNINPEKQDVYRMQSLKLTNLPTTGYFFYPTTKNVAANGQQKVLGEGGTPLSPSNQWFGRAVTYVLQPQGGALHWNIVYSSSYAEGESAVSQPESSSVSDAFTAWYRINARIGYSDQMTLKF